MIRKLTTQDEALLKTFACEKPEINTFLIGDIEHFGVSADFLEFWGDFHEDRLTGVLMRFYHNFNIYYSKADADPHPFVDVIKCHSESPQCISAENEVADAFSPFFEGVKVERSVLCRLSESAVLNVPGTTDIQIAKPKDAARIFTLIQTIEEFASFSRDQIEKTLASGAGRIYYIENESGEVISVAQTAAENSVSAMIVGVCTDKRYRRQGMMRRVMTKLCADMQKMDKKICLFYSNPDAGRTYLSLGFEPIGTWTMLKF